MKKLLLIFAAMAFLAVGCTPDFERYWESNLNAELPEIGDGDVNDDVNDDEDGNGNEGGEGGAYDYFTGKQWIWPDASEAMLFDFGLTLPGYLIAAEPSNGGYSMYSCGTYEVEEISDTEGYIIYYVEADGETGTELYYYEIISETQFAIIEEYSGEYYALYFDHVDDPYNINVNGASKPDESVLANGTYWIVANDLVAKPVTSSSYGYLYVEDAWKSDASVASTQANTFTFTSVDGGYTIQDAAGKYYYGTEFNNAWAKNFNVSATLPAEGAIWSIVKNDDDTYTITNTTQPSYIQYSISYNSFGHYTTAQSNAVLPKLVKVENVTMPALTLPASLTFEHGGGSQTITLPEGVTANATSNNAAFTAASASNVVTITTRATTDAQTGELTLVLAYGGFNMTKVVSLVQKAAPTEGSGDVKMATFDIASYSFSNQEALGTYTVGDITFAFADGGNSNGPKYYTSGSAVRCYPKNTITISGGTIKRVSVIAPSGYTNAIDLYDGNTKLTDFVWSGSSEKLVLTFDKTKTSGQSRFVKIEVEYL